MNRFIDIKDLLLKKGLKITPQRLAILNAIIELEDHPTAERIIAFIHEKHPNIATGTVYKVLDTLVENHLIFKVKTEKGIMRYDAITDSHHHLYCAESERIENYFDVELDHLVCEYFEKKKIPDFVIKDIKLQIIGKFKDTKITNL